MALTIPNIESNPTYDAQSVPDFTDWTALNALNQGTAVISGMQVTPSAGMTVNVASGQYTINNTAQKYAGGTLTISGAAAFDRKDIIVANISGVVSIVSGTNSTVSGWTRASTFLPPVKPSIPANAVVLSEVYVGASTTTIAVSNLIDKTPIGGQGVYFQVSNITASGTTQATATPITTQYTAVSGASATTNSGSGAGVILPSPIVGSTFVIDNTNASNWLILYPSGTNNIDQQTAASGVWIPPNGYWWGTAETATNWASVMAPMNADGTNTINVAYGNGQLLFGLKNPLTLPGALTVTSGITVTGTALITSGDITSNSTGVSFGSGNSATLANSIAIGYTALQNNGSSGIYNIAIGYQAMQVNTTGGYNVAIGTYSLQNNTTGTGNLSIGAGAMNTNSTGYQNIAIGSNALYTNSSGFNNSIIGFNALYANTSGTYNSAIGYNASYSGSKSYSTAFGANTVASANGTVAIGVDSSGNGAVATATNQFVLGTSNHTVIIPGAISFSGTVNAGGSTGTAGQFLVVNPGATSLEYRSLAVGTPTTAAQAASTIPVAVTVITGSLFQLPTNDLVVGSRFEWDIGITKTAAGVATWTAAVKFGTAGTTSDAAIATFTSTTNTAAADQAYLRIIMNVTATGTGTSATANCLAFYSKSYGTTNVTGLGNIPATPGSTAGFNSTATTPYLHIDITPGASAVMTAWAASVRLT